MDALSYLKDYSQRADKFLDKFFQKKLAEAARIGDSGNGLINVPQEMMWMYREYMRGGKKLRGCLVQLGYQIGGGNLDEILPATAAMEIIHSFALIHDDIMDKDDLRRGKPTMHKQWQHLSEKHHLNHKNTDQYGSALGMLVGDLGIVLGTELISNSSFQADKQLAALTFMTQFLARTIYGQGLDVTYEHSDHLTEADVLRVHLHKTAHYTISGPLKLGGLLSGLNPSQLQAIEQYGAAIGTAFQIRDDELGLFGDIGKTGKPVGSDIKENKISILKVKALELANSQQQTFLLKSYGNINLTEQEIDRVRQITIDTGALAYSQQRASELATQGKQAIPEITDKPEYQQLLHELADLMVKREK